MPEDTPTYLDTVRARQAEARTEITISSHVSTLVRH